MKNNMKKPFFSLLLLCCLISNIVLNVMAEDAPKPAPTPAPLATVTPTPAAPPEDLAKKEVVDFSSIKAVIQNDQLQAVAEEENKKILEAKARAEKLKMDSWNFPKEEEFWSFMSEWWLVQNAQVLSWDFERADLGIGEAVSKLFEKIGFIGKKIKILIINNAEVPHFALPSNKNEFIFLIAMPFMKAFDLTTLEISLIALEDFLRNEKGDKGVFRQYVTEKDLHKLYGQNFYQKEEQMKMDVLQKVSEHYSYFIFKKGFNFQEQYETTMQMARFIQDDEALWKSYRQLFDKLGSMMKGNERYKYYNRIYPSPEVQLGWLSAYEKK